MSERLNFMGFEDSYEDLGAYEFDDDGLEETIRNSNLSPDIASAMMESLEETKVDGPHPVIFVSTNGEHAIKAIHVPASAINGFNGPVLFPSANPLTIIAAFSKEYIEEQMELIEGVEPGLRDEAWMVCLEKMTEAITLEYENNPTSWDMKGLM
jgi:hypothetical protein